MTKFEYLATDKAGKLKKGSIEAKSREEAKEILDKQSFKPTFIKEAEKKSKFNLNMEIGKPRVKIKDKVVFTRQLSTMVGAGVPLVKSLSTLKDQTESRALANILPDLIRDVEGGTSLAGSMAKYPDIFGDIFVNMIRAGESGGILDEILERLALQQEKDAAIRGKLKSAMAYPVVILSITFVAFIYLMTSVVPKIGNIISDLAGEDYTPPLYTRIMLSISDFLTSYGLFLLVLLVVGGFFALRWFKKPSGRFFLHKTLLRIPIVKTLVTKVVLARFARIFSSLNSAGVGVLDSLKVTGKAIGNVVIEKDLEAAAKDVRAGKPLSQPLLDSKHFPPIVSQMVAVGEETGEIEQVLTKLADFYEEEVEQVANSLTSIIEPIMIVILGAIIGTIAISVFGPISSITQQI